MLCMYNTGHVFFKRNIKILIIITILLFNIALSYEEGINALQYYA